MVEDAARMVFLASMLGGPEQVPDEVLRARRRYVEEYGQGAVEEGSPVGAHT